jgi:hypothetical protein
VRPVVREVSDWDDYAGRLAASETVDVRARVGGYIEQAPFDEGMILKKGDLLFVIDARTYQAQLEGARADLARATDTVNQYQVERVLGAVEARLTDGGTVGILGLAYKPDTSVVEQSQGVLLANRLVENGHALVVFDPKALETAAALVVPLEEKTWTAAPGSPFAGDPAGEVLLGPEPAGDVAEKAARQRHPQIPAQSHPIAGRGWPVPPITVLGRDAEQSGDPLVAGGESDDLPAHAAPYDQ